MRMALIQRNGLLLFMIPIFCALQPTCSAVLGGQCTSDGECIGTVTNSACSASTCSCAAGYKEATNQCEKVITGSCTTNVDCTGTVANSECKGLSTCSCVAGYKEANDVCVKDTTCTHGDQTSGDTKCQQQDKNTVCSAQDTCVCNTNYYLSADGTNCVQKITTVGCTPAHNTEGDTKCQQVDAHSKCKTGTACTCKVGYKGTDSCTKVLGKTCGTDVDCTGLVANSVCSQQKICKCKDTYTEESAVCKTAGSTKPFATDTTCDPDHGGDAKCLGVDPNSECPASTTKCACKADYFLSSDKTCALKITTVACTPDDNTEGTTKCQKVDENSECPEGDKCACKAGYSGTDSCTKDAGSSATSAWMTTSLIATSLLVYLPRLIYG